jgi:hypothetical protein
VPKSGGGAVNLQVTAWAVSFCKSVGVCLRRFESCTCHTAIRASDLGVCPSGALRRTRGDQCSRVLPHKFRTGSRRRPDLAGHSRRGRKRAGGAEADPLPVQVNGVRYPRNPERQRASAVCSRLHTGQPVNAKEVLRAAQVGEDESTVRRWCRSWEKEAGVDLDVRRVVPAGADGAPGETLRHEVTLGPQEGRG